MKVFVVNIHIAPLVSTNVYATSDRAVEFINNYTKNLTDYSTDQQGELVTVKHPKTRQVILTCTPLCIIE